jgi:hypothetical protein
LQGANQILPEEYVEERDVVARQKEYERFFAHTTENDASWEETSSKPLKAIDPLAGRGNFNASSVRAYSVLRSPIVMCANTKKELINPRTDNGPMGSAGMPIQGLEIMMNYETGLAADPSILPLIPRAALWLERLDPSRYHMFACFRQLTSNAVRELLSILPVS